MIRYCISFSLLCMVPVFGQSEQSLTPRELFYTPAAKPLAAQGEKKTTPAPKKQQTPKLTPAAYTPLGLRYSLLYSSDGERYSEVDADAVFRSGDKLKFSTQSNEPAYLYVISRGSSGSWQVLFPSSEMGGGDNKVAAMQRLELPHGDYRFNFDKTPGEEKLFFVLSRKPVENLDELIYDLNKPKKDANPEKRTMLAQRIGSIDDALVGGLRAGVQPRDLVLEKVDEKTAGDRKEKAVYIVNTKNSPDARLVVDLTLKHH